MLVAHYSERQLAASTVLTHDTGQVTAVGQPLIANFHHHVPGFNTGLFGRAAFLHRAYEHAFTVLHAKEIPKLGRKVLRLHAQSAGHGGDGDRGIIDAVSVIAVGHERRSGNAGERFSDYFAVYRQLNRNLQRISVAADAQNHRASRRRFTNQATKLFFAFYGRAVEIENYVVLTKACFPRWSILIDHCYFHAPLLFQLERAHTVLRDVTYINAEVRAASW